MRGATVAPSISEGNPTLTSEYENSRTRCTYSNIRSAWNDCSRCGAVVANESIQRPHLATELPIALRDGWTCSVLLERADTGGLSGTCWLFHYAHLE